MGDPVDRCLLAGTRHDRPPEPFGHACGDLAPASLKVGLVGKLPNSASSIRGDLAPASFVGIGGLLECDDCRPMRKPTINLFVSRPNQFNESLCNLWFLTCFRLSTGFICYAIQEVHREGKPISKLQFLAAATALDRSTLNLRMSATTALHCVHCLRPTASAGQEGEESWAFRNGGRTLTVRPSPRIATFGGIPKPTVTLGACYIFVEHHEVPKRQALVRQSVTGKVLVGFGEVA